MSAFIRDENGRFAPGTPPGPGRPPKAQELAILDAIRTTFTPEQVKQYLEKAMRLAESQNSARAMIAVLEFAAGYTLGKPVARVETGNTNAIDQALARMAAMGLGGDE